MLRPANRCTMTWLAAAVLMATATLAQAQVLRVHLVDEETRQPLAGVLVSALDAGGAMGPSVLSSGDGIATVRASGTGPYRLLIRRIGFAPVITEPITVPSEAGQALDVAVPVHRITLGTVRVVGNQSCAEQTDSPSALAQPAWTEVRTALEASALTRDQRLVTTAALRFQRELRRDGTVDFADTTLRGRSGERPFFAPNPALLERDGYFKHHDDGSEDFYAPDEAVLLSAGFTRRHCLSVFPDVRRDSAGTQIALAFVPRDRDTRPEIKGLIWLDSATSELRRIDFEYVRISLRAPADSIGGSVAFRHLSSGAWIVSAWTLRMPRFRVVDRRANYTVLDGYIEVGGSASVVRDVATPGPNVPRRIVGSVYDSLAQRPLAGAHVHLADLGRDAVADSLGTFRFDSVGASIHTLWADHPRLDTLGLFSLGARIDATPQAVTSVMLAIPDFATLWHRACGKEPLSRDGDGFVFGRVIADTSRGRTRGATIEISWSAIATDSTRPKAVASRRTVQPDSTGNYAVCGIPAQHSVTLSLSGDDGATVPVSFRVGPARIARRDLTLPSKAAIEALGGDTSRVALVQQADDATLSGVVRDSTGQPVRDARVSVTGVAKEWRADAQGGFALRGIPPGTRVIAISAEGYGTERRLVDLAPEDSAYVALSLSRSVFYALPRTLRVVSADGQPVVYANVSVEGGTTLITDQKGEVGLGVGQHQSLTVRVRRIGFTPWFGKVDFPDTSSVLTVTLAHVAQQLGEVRVTGQKNPSSPFVQGFYDRWMQRQKGLLSATFIGPEELEFRHPGKITNMLRGLNGVCIGPAVITNDGGRTKGLSSQVYAFSSHSGSLEPNEGCPICPMAIVIDGQQQYPPSSPGVVSIDAILNASDVMAIEVYERGGNMPISLQVNDTKCGVIAFWTGSRR
jgi:Carboxypeptidase regulatory-like domain